MKVSVLIAKHRKLPPYSDLTEVDVLRLFDDNSVARELNAKFEQVQAFLARGDLDGLRELIEKQRLGTE
jgi:hypothetical protein